MSDLNKRTSAQASIADRLRNSQGRVRQRMTYPTPQRTLRAPATEVKCLDWPQTTGLGLDTTGSVQCLNLIRVGSTFNNRIGRKVQLKSIYLNGFIYNNAVNSGYSMCRFLVVYDRQANGANPTYGDVITSLDQGTTTSSTVYDGINLNNRDRFKILLDKRVITPALAAGVVTGPSMVTGEEFRISEFRSLKGLDTQFKADSSPAVIGDIATGSLFLMTIGSQPAATGWGATMNIRLRFTDN